MRGIEHLNGTGRRALESVIASVRGAGHVYLTGIGASWNAALAAGAIFHSGGRPVYMLDAAELLHFSKLPPDAVVIILSRSGRSVEIVKLLVKAREAGATVVGITNFEDGPLAHDADMTIMVPVKADHGISVNTYSALALAAAAVASAVVGSFDETLTTALSKAIAESAERIPAWQQQLAHTPWLTPGAPYYFLARGPSLSSAHEARLMWEEGAKQPATAMGTGSFGHGPQEVMTKNLRVAMWIDSERMREQDLAIARDLRNIGAAVMLIGHNVPKDAGDLVIQLPPSPPNWQFVIDIFPAQLAVWRLAHISGVDCNSFRFASYVVEDDSSLLDNGVTSATPAEPATTKHN